MADIMHLIRTQAPPERVYAALTTPEGIHNWWTREAELDAKVSGRGEFRFFGDRMVTRVEVAALQPQTHVGWKVLTCTPAAAWNGTMITFDLRPEGDQTVLLFAHRGFPQADEGYAQTTTGWGYYLLSLHQYLETGTGTPAPDVDPFARVRA